MTEIKILAYWHTIYIQYVKKVMPLTTEEEYPIGKSVQSHLKI